MTKELKDYIKDNIESLQEFNLPATFITEAPYGCLKELLDVLEDSEIDITNGDFNLKDKVPFNPENGNEELRDNVCKDGWNDLSHVYHIDSKDTYRYVQSVKEAEFLDLDGRGSFNRIVWWVDFDMYDNLAGYLELCGLEDDVAIFKYDNTDDLYVKVEDEDTGTIIVWIDIEKTNNYIENYLRNQAINIIDNYAQLKE